MNNHPKALEMCQIETPLGPMVAIGDKEALYLLAFVNQKGLERGKKRLQKTTKLPIASGKPPPIQQIEKELEGYFSGTLREFKTPLFFIGSSFQKAVWKALQKIPAGKTQSYAEIATAIERPTAFRAVANANGANPFAIIVPCHRVINTGGELGGYGGGLGRKRWLLKHEKG